ncbi:MAG: hypothetical protein KF814_07580 [Nitrospiraceae bacterium]|nr:hypothetical protein [Nitrospiraceae bacterium]
MARTNRSTRFIRWVLLSVLCMIALSVLSAAAAVEIIPGAAGELDPQTVADVVTLFRRADQAVQARDVGGVMVLYSEHYNYHGLSKADLAKVWSDLFDEYKDLSDIHRFSKFTKVGAGSKAVIEVTCTGSLWGLSKTSGLRVPIDSWFQEIHYLSSEEGGWRLRGNVGEIPRLMPFGTSPHPLF